MINTDPPQRFVRPVEPASMVDQVAKEIRRSIVSGSLKPGQTFSLREIAAQLGISFIPVREALRRLETEGLVVTRPGRSAYVTPLNDDDLRGIYGLRRRLEPDLAARSCCMLDDSDYLRLHRYVNILGDGQRGIDEIYDAHHQFHLALLRPAATGWDLRILGGLWHAAERYVRLVLSRRVTASTQLVVAYTALLEAFQGAEPPKVFAAFNDHLDMGEALARGALLPTVG
jgi:DNA-binding GntR family transcriptional regulator